MRRTSKRTKPKKPKKPKKKVMQAWILTRDSLTQPGAYVVMGVYTSLANAEAARDAGINAFVAARNAARDAAYAAGESYDAELTYADVLPFALITEVTVNA